MPTPETLREMAGRLCLSQRGCADCPLTAYAPCKTVHMEPEKYPAQVAIIKTWAEEHNANREEQPSGRKEGRARRPGVHRHCV